MTGDLQARTLQHRPRRRRFLIAFKIFRLVHFEMFADVRAAMGHETEIKAWRREKKIRLIESKNPTWQDLAGGCRTYTKLSNDEVDYASASEA